MIKLVFYTNCQCRGLYYFIKNHINKIETKHIENYSIIKNKNKIPFDILKQADIFIYQPIDKKHGIYSTDTSVENNILSYLSPNCKIISFPYIYNSSLWILIPPANVDPEDYFKEMRELNNSHGFAELSMGMSSDFLLAAKYSSTFVRIGSSIFGQRS